MIKEIRKIFNTIIERNIGSLIFIVGFSLLLYIWFTQGNPIFESWRKLGLFTTILPFVFSILSWTIGVLGYKRNRYGKQIQYMAFSFSCCGIATRIFILDIDLKIRNNDMSSLRDLAVYYSCVSLFVWMITIWINIQTCKKGEIENKKKEN